MRKIEFKYNNCSYIAYEDGRIYSKHFKRFLKTYKQYSSYLETRTYEN